MFISLRAGNANFSEYRMHKFIVQLGYFSGILSVLVCLIAGLARITGFYYIAGYQSTTVFTAGVGLMVFACLLKLETLLKQGRGE